MSFHETAHEEAKHLQAYYFSIGVIPSLASDLASEYWKRRALCEQDIVIVEVLRDTKFHGREYNLPKEKGDTNGNQE